LRWARDRKDNWVQQGVVVAAVRQQTIGNVVREKALWRIKKRYQMTGWSGVHYRYESRRSREESYGGMKWD